MESGQFAASLPDSAHKHIWDACQIEATYNALLHQASDHQARARLMAVSCSVSGAWLHALSIAGLGVRVSEDVVRIAAGHHRGVPLCRLHLYSGCGADDGALGTQWLSCRFSTCHHSCHAAVLESAKIPCHLEPSGVFRSDGMRPDGAFEVP